MNTVKHEKQKCEHTRDIVLRIFFSQFYLFLPGVLLLCAEAVMKTYIPLLTGDIVDELTLLPDDLTYAKSMMTRLAAVAVVAFCVKFVWRFLLMGNGRRYEKLLREKAFEKLSLLDSRFCDTNHTGDIITRMISDITAIRAALSFGITSIFDIGLSMVMPFYVMITKMTLPMTLTAFAAVPPILLFLILIRRMIAARFLKIQEANAALAGKIEENISGIREIKSYGREDYESETVKKLSQNRFDAEINQVKLSAMLKPVSSIGFAITYAVFIIIGGIMVFDGRLSVGTYITFNTYIGIMTSPMLRISRQVQIWQKGIASMKRLDVIFMSDTPIDDSCADFSITEIEPSISVKGLNFAYEPGKDVLHDINIELKAGKTLGVMGRTGSGKSALLDALSRRYEIPEGMVYIGGHDINSIPLDVLKKTEGCVLQDGFLFSDTVYNNIDFYSGAGESEVIHAAEIADIHGNIEDFPDKYETVVGERGVTLSGGQRQRISIARAIVKKPKLLLLDDCMSAVDTETEKRIIEGLNSEAKNMTTVITAHRASAVMNADEIIYLEDGRIAERGTHSELMALRGRYYSLYMQQSKREEE